MYLAGEHRYSGQRTHFRSVIIYWMLWHDQLNDRGWLGNDTGVYFFRMCGIDRRASSGQYKIHLYHGVQELHQPDQHSFT